jgi:hypothetical protein
MGDPDIQPPGAIRLKGSEVFLFAALGNLFSSAAILRWDGLAWNEIARRPKEGCLECSDTPIDMISLGDDFYYLLFPGIGKWDGTNWVALGSGFGVPNPPPLTGIALSLASNGSELYVGGDFSWAGGKPSSNIALWHIPHALSVSRSENLLRLSWPATGTNFVLQYAKSLAQSNWNDVVQIPVIANNRLIITNEISDNQSFFRLRRR